MKQIIKFLLGILFLREVLKPLLAKTTQPIITTMNGIRYLIITYPGFISLPDTSGVLYQFNGVNTFVVVHEHLEAVQIIDFTNTLSRTAANIPFLEKPAHVISDKNLMVKYEIDGVPRTSVYDYKLGSEKVITNKFYTVLTFIYEIADPDNVSQEDEELGKTLLTEFIHTYKHISKDARIRLPHDTGSQPIIEKEAIIKYTDEEKALSIEKRLLSKREMNIGVKSFTAFDPKQSLPQSNLQIEDNYESLKRFFVSGQSVNEEFRLLSKAFEEIDLNRNYKYALLESFIVAETAISRIIYQLKLKRGVSKGKLDDYKTEVSISYQINVELPILLDALTNSERGILGGIDKIRKTRNDVVHNGLQVTEEMALEALNNTYKLINLLIQRGLI